MEALPTHPNGRRCRPRKMTRMGHRNSTIECQLSHRTIRRFSSQRVSDEVFAELMAVARRTASSRCAQHSSIIRITDQHLKDDMANNATQAYMADAPELLLFLVDTHRNQRILDECGSTGYGARSMDAFFEGWTDACLMAQNVVVAAESMGLGTNYFGNVLNDPGRVISLLHLPELTFPVLGLTFGYPAEDPQLKPRMDMSLRVMENGYTEPESWVDALADYDVALHTYYDLRENGRRNDSFTRQMVDKLAAVRTERHHIVQYVRAQGWDLALDD